MKTVCTKFSLVTLFIMCLSQLSAQWSEIGPAGFSSGGTMRNVTAVSGSTIYMGYTESPSNMPTVMKSTGGTWSVVGTASIGGVAAYAFDMVVDNSGVPHIATIDINGKVQVMRWSGTIWTTVGTGTFATASGNQDLAMAFDNTNAPNVIFQDAANSGRLSAMKYNGASWAYVGTPGFSGGSSIYFAMAKHPSTGALYVAYQDNAALNRATIETFNGTNWVLVGTAGGASGTSGINDIDIAINSSGTPHIIYPDASNGNRATVRAYNGSAWVVVGAAGFSAGASSYNGIVFNSTGTLYAAYRDGGNSAKASAMTFNGTAWATLGTAGFSASTVTATSLLLNSAGQLCVGYCDESKSSRATVMKYCTAATGSILSVSGGTTCGSGSVTISGTATPGSINWYNAPTSGTFIISSNSFTAWVTSTLTYYGAAVDANGCVSATRTAVTASSIPYPTITGIQGASICSGSTAAITATPSMGSVNWYTISVGSTPQGTTNTWTTPPLTTNTTYYAQSIHMGCTTYPRTAVTVTVRPIPTINVAGNTTLCAGNTTTLTASGASTYTWNTGPTTNSIALNPTVTAIYTVTATNTQTCSNTKTVQVTVNVCTGIEELSLNGNLNVYPNPNNGTFTIITPEKGTYSIVNSIGQTIQTIEIKEDQQPISVEDLAAGIYYVIGKNTKAKIVATR